MDKIYAVLQFFRLLDESNRLSLTNLAVAGSFIAMLLRPEVALTDVATFAASLIGYGAKRFATGGTAAQDNAALQEAVAKLETKVTGLQLGQQAQKR